MVFPYANIPLYLHILHVPAPSCHLTLLLQLEAGAAAQLAALAGEAEAAAEARAAAALADAAAQHAQQLEAAAAEHEAQVRRPLQPLPSPFLPLFTFLSLLLLTTFLNSVILLPP